MLTPGAFLGPERASSESSAKSVARSGLEPFYTTLVQGGPKIWKETPVHSLREIVRSTKGTHILSEIIPGTKHIQRMIDMPVNHSLGIITVIAVWSVIDPNTLSLDDVVP